jgi:hypothetical protein
MPCEKEDLLMHGRYSLFIAATSLLLGACAGDVAPIPDDRDAIHENCVEVEPDTWECDQGIAAKATPGSVTGSLIPDQGGVEEPLVYGRVYDPSGCYYCGQHSGQGLYDWAPCPWGESIYRYHCVACNYWGNYDRILYDCGSPALTTEPASELGEVAPEGELEVSMEE